MILLIILYILQSFNSSFFMVYVENLNKKTFLQNGHKFFRVGGILSESVLDSKQFF